MNYPTEIAFALQKICDTGFEAYLIGGCVRDFWMGREISDYDIATDAAPNEIKGIFEGFLQNKIGERHGTIGVLVQKRWIEITTFRRDGVYKDHRHPERVSFSRSLDEDLARRDFTINAMAYSERDGWIDPFDGKKDIKGRVIRAVGNPSIRFREDALRILRAVRFASQLDFTVEEETLAAMKDNRSLLEKISAERKSAELVKTLEGQAIERVLLEHAEILAELLPELLRMKNFDQNNPYHIYDVLTHTAKVVANTPSDRVLRLAALFHDVGKVYSYTEDEQGIGHFYGHGKISEEIVLQTLRRLRFDTRTVKEVHLLVKYHDAQIELSKKIIRRWLHRLGEGLFFKLLTLKRADNLAKSPSCNRQAELDEIERLAKKVIAEKECFSLRDMAIGGHELTALGFEGKKVGEILNELLCLVIDGTLQNEREQLIKKVREHYGK